MTADNLNKIKAMIDSELNKLISHLEASDPDDRDICRTKELLKIYKLAHELSTVVK